MKQRKRASVAMLCLTLSMFLKMDKKEENWCSFYGKELLDFMFILCMHFTLLVAHIHVLQNRIYCTSSSVYGRLIKLFSDFHLPKYL